MSYVVFAVENADRMVLMGPPVAGKPTFKAITLSYIQAPKLARRLPTGEFTPEDPYAYEAAELIRSTFIGKPVRFAEDYYIEALQRSAGRIMGANSQEASAMLLKEGYATMPDRPPAGMEKELFDIYSLMSSAAKAARKGIFSADAAKHVRAMRVYSPEELTQKIEGIKGLELLSRIERVISSSVIVISTKELGDTQFMAHLTGISANAMGDDEAAANGKLHMERLLLNRNVKIRFDGIDNHGNPLVSIMSPNGTFQEELLSKGYAKIFNPTLSFSSQIDMLTASETEAKRRRAGCWKDYVEPVSEVAGEEDGETAATVEGAAPEVKLPGLPTKLPDGTPGPRYMGPIEFYGTLVQVVHGDTVVVCEEPTGTNIRVSLTGVRCSKNIQRDQDGNSPETRITYNDYSYEAKDFLRSRYVGKHVTVVVEYARVMPETKEVRPSATVVIHETGVNIAAALLETGYATFMLGKNQSCSKATELAAAEEAARTAVKGIHSQATPPTTTVLELSHLGETRSRYYLSFLQRGMQGNRPPMVKGVVDLVLGPSSLRVYVRKENFQIPVKVAGVTTPSAAFNQNEKADPYAEEAKTFAIRLAQQRDVTIQVFTSDRPGNFISAVFLPDGTNLSVALVAAGFATVGNADRLPFAQELLDAEVAAREAKKNIWSTNGGVPQRAIKMEQERAAMHPNALVRVLDETATLTPYVITEVAEDGLSVYLQTYGPEVDKVKSKIQDLLNHTVANEPYKPKKGERVTAQFKEDKTWCRAQVLKAPKDDMVEVQFIDFGNTDKVIVDNIRAVPRGPEYAVVRDTPAFAILARLAFLKTTVPSDMFASAAYDAVYEYTDGEVLAKAVYRNSGGTTFYTVTVNENVPSLSETLLQRGLALLDTRTAKVDTSEYRRHEAAQEIARKGHKALWQYGDVDENEEDY